MSNPEQGEKPEKKLNQLKDLILNATEYGGDYEIQRLADEQLAIRIKAKNEQYASELERELQALGYSTKKGAPDSHGRQTIYLQEDLYFSKQDIDNLSETEDIIVDDLRIPEDKEKQRLRIIDRSKN